MRTIRETWEINSPIEKVWQALIDSVEIEAWSAGPAKMENTEGGLFSLWGGQIYGTNTEIDPGKKLIQDWYFGQNTEPTKVTFLLKSKDEKTIVDLIHEDIPDKDVTELEKGWREDYLGKIKKYLEE